MIHRHLTLAALLLLGAPHARAQATSELPLWELGAGVVAASQPAYLGASQRVSAVVPVPYFVYRGELLRADRDGVGLRALVSDDIEVDLGAAVSLGAWNEDIRAREGMREIGASVEVGPRVKWRLAQSPGGGAWRAELAVRGVFDVQDSLRWMGTTSEARLVFGRRAGAWTYEAGGGAILGDRRLARTFYAVTPGEARPGRPSYEAEAGLFGWRLGLTASRAITNDLRLFAATRLDSVAGAANRDSPLVERTTSASVAAGLIYTWTRSARTVTR